MVPSVKIVTTLDESVWRRYVQQHPHGNVFHSPEMFEVFQRARGHQPELWAARNNSNDLLALLLPVNVTLIRGLLAPLTSRSVVYGGVLCEPTSEGHAALRHLLTAYNQQAAQKSIFTEVRNLSDASGIQPILQENRFVYEDHLDFLIDLHRPEGEIWDSLHGNVRTNVRKARRMGVVIEEATTPDKIPVAYTLLAKTYDHIQVPLAPLILFESAFEVLYPRGMIKFYMARVDTIYIGVAIRLLYKDVIYCWYVGVDREYHSYKATDLLNWHALEWGAQNGFRCYDFGGAGKPGEHYGPREFKSKFGGQLVSYGRNVCVHSPLRLKLSQVGYRLTRRFLSEGQVRP
jgi:serine/alanine adding enzyme